MNISIVGRHITLTDDLKKHIESTIQTFGKYNLDIISINSIITKEQKQGKDVITFEYLLNVAHQNTIVVKQKDKNLYSAIDIATSRVCKILRRYSDKLKSHKNEKLTNIAINDEEDKIAKELESLEDEIVPLRLQSYKPMQINEALKELKADDGIFKVFYDLDDNFRVLYKMKNDSKYGLY
ncbi:Ribosomal subunit interface protein [hydrothermal vent metagenome]|uniref:Ribosomal subunit interface protein n=1 Tax=hydrothermal vent metagenome TaxID=652676 RepID=A0A3B1EAB1_9ZZZZ